MTILIVEDEMLIGLALADTLERAGHSVRGPFPACDEALEAIEARPPKAAILDVNLGGSHTSEPVAMALAERDIPFVFVTGYSEVRSIRDQFPGVRHFPKPLPPATLITIVDDLLGKD